MSKLNTNSNAYIIIYSTILVVIVAFLLAFVSSSLKAKQEANVALDVKKQILNSLNLRGLDDAQAEAKYTEVVKDEKELDGQKFYTCEINGEEILVVSLKGMGLWGGISGYIALHGEDEITVYGAYFNHESETAGLGAEIKDSQAWQEKFIGKKVFDGDEVALSVVKNVDDPETQVDCVTGATLTSNGVNDMIKAGLLKSIQFYKASLEEGGSDCCSMKKGGDCCSTKEGGDCCSMKEGGDCCSMKEGGDCKSHDKQSDCCNDKAATE